MAYTYHELKTKTIADLREIAKGLTDESVQGHSQMNKDHLLPALCKVLGVDMHEHHVVVGINKTDRKARIRALKVEREKALGASDHDALKNIRRQIHRINRDIKRHLA